MLGGTEGGGQTQERPSPSDWRCRPPKPSPLWSTSSRVPGMSDVDPWVPVIAPLLGFFLSPFTKRSEVRNTIRSTPIRRAKRAQ